MIRNKSVVKRCVFKSLCIPVVCLTGLPNLNIFYFGFSGNPGIKMLGYKFDDCAFRTESDLTVNIAMKYINL